MTLSNDFVVDQIETTLDDCIKKNPSKVVFIILNTVFIKNNCRWPVNSLCLHLKTKYNNLQWPKLCDSNSEEPVLFIGIVSD